MTTGLTKPRINRPLDILPCCDVLRTAVVAGMMADTSPEWKKPADIMKLRRRRSLRTDLCTTKTTAQPNSRLSLETCLPTRKQQKRKNPFACLSSSMKTNKDDEEDTAVGDSIGSAEAEMKCGEAASNCFIDVLVCFELWCGSTVVCACSRLHYHSFMMLRSNLFITVCEVY